MAKDLAATTFRPWNDAAFYFLVPLDVLLSPLDVGVDLDCLLVLWGLRDQVIIRDYTL